MISRYPIIFLSVVILGHDFSAAPIEYNRDIRPILAENCFDCHGGDKHKGGLRLDRREVATKPGKSGETAIVPGKPDISEMIRRMTSGDEELHMPPAETEHKLTDGQIDLLRRWISEGAAYQGHWAFSAPARPNLPAVKNETWCRNAIDRFVLAKLEAAGMRPSAEAEKVTLLRRLHLDLIGLPPTVAEVDAFLADQSADAYEKQVERLLASPHYGERWGRHWLDAARYADSNGYQRDKPREIWPYRDYVIDSFNRDLPYDQFIVEQIAGDELPHPTQEQIVATGFLRNSMMNDEGGVDPEEFRLAAMFDRIEAVGTGILGLTIQCAQCHSHKYDPLSQEEYYRLFAFLNDADETQPVVYGAEEQRKIAELTGKMRGIEAELRGRMADWEERMAAWEKQVSEHQPHWTVLPMEYAGDQAEHWYTELGDHSFLATPSAPRSTASFTWTSKLPRITAFRLELLTDPTLPCGGPGCSPTGTCALTEFSVEIAPVAEPGKKTAVKFAGASSDYEQIELPLEPMFADGSGARRVTGPVKFAIDGSEATAWGIDAGPGRRNQNRKAVFQCATPIVAAAAVFPQPVGTIITFHLGQGHSGSGGDDRTNNNLGRFRISATTDDGVLTADPLPKRVREILAIPSARQSKAQAAEVFSYWRSTVPEWKEANERIEALSKQWPAGSTTLALAPRTRPRETRVFARGDLRKPAQTVTAGVPAFLHPLAADYEPNRLTLARWLVDRNSPTTARAFVNRMWQAYFGTGIVATAEDLGAQAEEPSHRELLDWLACEFMEGGWSVKRVQRLIVMSATYRQSSRITPEGYAKDPNNRLLARGARFRVEGEIVRDIALSASGLLNPKIGGRSVMPPAPAFLFQPPSSFAPFPWMEESGDEKYRREIYTFHRRSTPYPMLQAFDGPTAVASCARRWRSNTPLQALTTLNEPIFVDCAKALARRAIDEGGATDGERMTYLFRRVLARRPAEGELKELLALFQKEKERLSDVVAYTVVARVVMNLDEAVTKD